MVGIRRRNGRGKSDKTRKLNEDELWGQFNGFILKAFKYFFLL